MSHSHYVAEGPSVPSLLLLAPSVCTRLTVGVRLAFPPRWNSLVTVPAAVVTFMATGYCPGGPPRRVGTIADGRSDLATVRQD